MTKYRTIVADPPWEMPAFTEWGSAKGARQFPYSFMGLDEIKALPVKSWANNRDADAHLFLWTTAQFLRASYDVAEAWAFEPMYPLVWCKPPRGMGPGGKFASNIEFVLYCKRSGYTSVDAREPRDDIATVTSRLGEIARAAGFSNARLNALVGSSDIASWWTSALPRRCAIPKPEHWQTLVASIPALGELSEAVERFNAEKGQDRKPPAPLQGRIDTRWFQWPRGAHSEKPEAFLDLVEQVCPGPYLEMFARRARMGWDYWGNESLNTAEVAA